MAQRKYDSTVARIAGNIASGMRADEWRSEHIARVSVTIARLIVAETIRTEPDPSQEK